MYYFIDVCNLNIMKFPMIKWELCEPAACIIRKQA